MEGIVLLSAVAVVVMFIIFTSIILGRYRKVGPNEVLIVSGRKRKLIDSRGNVSTVGYRLVKGGGTFVWPVIEKMDILSLEVMTLDIITPEVYTQLGVPIIVEGVAQIKFKGDDVSIGTAAEQFLNKSRQEVMNIAHQTVEGHLRAILGTMTVEEVNSDREAFARKVQEVSATDMSNMGLMIVSFTIKNIRDKQGYLDALGRARLAEVQRDAAIGEAEAKKEADSRTAEAKKEADIRTAEARRDTIIKTSLAEQTAKEAQFSAQAKIAQSEYNAKTTAAEAEKDFGLKKAEYDALVMQKRADADIAYELEKKTKEIELQEREIVRKEKELIATVNKPAEADKTKIEIMANAEKYRLTTTAQGQAEATKTAGFAKADVTKAEGLAEAEANKAKGLAEAEINKAKGIAEAEVVKTKGLAEAEVVKTKGLAEAEAIKAKGLAEAEAMNKKAEAWANYTGAAVIQMIVEGLPGLASAIAQPLSKMDKMVVINSGSDGGGVSKVTKDVTDAISQLPPILESLTGIKFPELVKSIAEKGTFTIKGNSQTNTGQKTN